MQQELYKIIIVLGVALIGSWIMFIRFVNRWVETKDANIKELYESRLTICNEIVEIKATCKERHKNE